LRENAPERGQALARGMNTERSSLFDRSLPNAPMENGNT
jgi:hypothetical protein